MIGRNVNESKALKRITKEHVEIAMHHTSSNSAAARYLGITFGTYKKYASLYKDINGISLYDKHNNRGGIGIKKANGKKLYEKLLREVVTGKIIPPDFRVKYLKERLVTEGYKIACCEQCGYKEKRKLDGKVPLILTFRDADKKNWLLYNLQFLCYNCYYISISDVFSESQLKALEAHGYSQAYKFDFELPSEQSKAIEKSINLQNKYTRDIVLDGPIDRTLPGMPTDYGSDLICYLKP